jgi:hypothetical protein
VSRARQPEHPTGGDDMPSVDAQTGYAPVGDLDLYYEIHGSGRPLLLNLAAAASPSRNPAPPPSDQILSRLSLAAIQVPVAGRPVEPETLTDGVRLIEAPLRFGAVAGAVAQQEHAGVVLLGVGDPGR